jgi:hypothetical protein
LADGPGCARRAANARRLPTPLRMAPAGLVPGQDRHLFPSAPDNLTKARALCEICGVRQESFDYAMAAPDLEGVFAGFTAQERAEMRRTRVA